MPPRFQSVPDLSDMLEVTKWDEPHFDDLIALNGPKEGLHVDYKEGGWLGTPDIKGKLRRYVGGFANAEGGALIIGISDHPGPGARPTGHPLRKVGITRRVGDLRSWLLDIIHGGVYPALQPPPRVYVFGHPGAQYAVILVEPAYEGLVSVRAGNKTVFPARVDDRTIDLDEWMVRAVLLGTRRSPRLVVRLCTKEGTAQYAKNAKGGISFSAALVLQNDGFVWANSPRWGLVAPGKIVGNSTIVPKNPLSQSISAMVSRHNPVHHMVYRNNIPDLEPFSSVPLPLSGQVLLDIGAELLALRMGLYVLGKNLMPRWFYIELRPTEREGIGTVEVRPIEPPVAVGFERVAGS